MIELTKYTACMCEGKSERTIMSILDTNNCLIFKKENLIDSRFLPRMKPKDFCKRFMILKHSEPVTLIRILDSPNEKFIVPKEYKNEINLINVYTRREIEMLIIHSESKFYDYKKKERKLKPSDYCKQILNMPQVKTQKFLYNYFNDPNKLISAINSYYKALPKSHREYCLKDLLK